MCRELFHGHFKWAKLDPNVSFTAGPPVKHTFVHYSIGKRCRRRCRSAPPGCGTAPPGSAAAAVRAEEKVEKRVAMDGKLYSSAEFEQYYGEDGKTFWSQAKRACSYCSTFKLIRDGFYNFPGLVATFGEEVAQNMWKWKRPVDLERLRWRKRKELYDKVPSVCRHVGRSCPLEVCHQPPCVHLMHGLCNRHGCSLCHCQGP